ncbi:ATP-binding cassette domain-containing protein [Cellulosimicrobium marinum]|uniref:ATP-binding cassette domain-containing protein n=1 Tax=Cellulosimicrobium marinum TaxID=1638992 RepID=UPI001E5E929D|nr:ABC transporter ATP-binding protein [Cellulosimicrobium marinum]MCB7136259.1 ABC transporter ATP-binding protein [Cellulosimicrobium marinum]
MTSPTDKPADEHSGTHSDRPGPTPPEPFAAELRDVVVQYSRRGERALDGATLRVRPGVITGLLGRNGAGKTTLAALLAAFRRPTAGRVLVGEPGELEDPFENAWTTMHTQLVRESGDVWDTDKAKDALAYYADMRPLWDDALAGRLLDELEVDVRKKPSEMSRGKRSALGAVIGLASRAPLTIFDEVYLGMDAPSRYAFYDALVADYTEHPRTILLSSHLISEVERIFEDVVIIARGRVLLAEDADDVRARGVSVTGPFEAVERFAAGREVLARQRLGGTAQVTLFGEVTAAERAAATDAGLEVGAVPVQDLFVHLTRTGTDEKEGSR